LSDVTQIVWIPPAEFCPIPLCAARHPIAFIEGRIIDAHEIVTAPSFQIWGQIHAGKTKDLSSASVCGLFNPTHDLIFAGIEEHLITSLAKQMALAKIAGGTDVNILLENLAGHDIWHFATHYRFDWANYLMSGLELGRDTSGSAQRLCIEDILYQSDSHAPQLVLLTVCDSSHSDIKHHPDEMMGLPTAFLAKGARGVISASWKVNDLATALLVARVYDGLASRGTHPASALRQAQIWLRDSSGIELFEYLQTVYLALPTDSAIRQFEPLIRQAAAIAEDPAPFSDERFWAGFTYMGA
ncbi:MAG: CHAT domain-containing protein, partial [Pseudomonadota bacterium]